LAGEVVEEYFPGAGRGIRIAHLVGSLIKEGQAINGNETQAVIIERDAIVFQVRQEIGVHQF